MLADGGSNPPASTNNKPGAPKGTGFFIGRKAAVWACKVGVHNMPGAFCTAQRPQGQRHGWRWVQSPTHTEAPKQ